MSGDKSVTSTASLLREMKDQITVLTTKVEELEHNQAGDSGLTTQVEDEDDAMGPGNLVTLMESTQAFLEAAISTMLANTDRKKWVERIGVPDCDSIRCPKLDPVIKAIVPNEVTKADGYLSHLQQFWLDATAPLTTIIETAEEGKLTPDVAVSAVQTALFLMGNAHQHMAQEGHKRILMNLNPAIKSMASDEKVFRKAAPMLFGDEFAKLAAERVDQLKAISKFSKPAEQKRNHFLDPTPEIPPRAAAGVETEAAKVGSSHTRGPAALDQTKTTKDRNNRKIFSGKLYTYANRDSYRVTPYCVQEKHAECDLALNKKGYICYSACGADQAFLTKLAPDDARPLGPTSGTGVSASINTNPNSKNLASRGFFSIRSEETDHRGGRGAETQRSNKSSMSSSRSFCLATIPSPKEGWWTAPGNISKGTEQIHTSRSLQDGGLSHGERVGETAGLGDESGFKGRILSSPNSPRPPQVPPVSVGGPDIPVLLPAVWPVMCSKSFYKVDEASGGLSEGKRNKTDNLSGRYAGNMQFPGGTERECSLDQGPLRSTGIDHQREEVAVGTYAIYHVS